LSACPNCGHQLPLDALFCPECGTSVAQPGAQLQQATAQAPQTPSPEPTYEVPPASPPEKPSFMARRSVVVVVILVLVVLLIGTTFESGLISTGNSSTAINSASKPFTGEQLYSAYSENRAMAASQYTNKTVYIQDTLDFGVSVDLRSGEYFSTVNQGTVVLIWNSPSQVQTLVAGNTVLAKCSVAGAVNSPGVGTIFVYLQDCSLVSVQSPSTSTANAAGVPASNV
jgi:hypothetical protein